MMEITSIIEKYALECLYDRYICRRLGIDYNNPTREDFEKAKEYIQKKIRKVE